MTKYELALHESYVTNWGVREALRELLQNMNDQEVVDKSNPKFVEYNKDNETLHMGNAKSVLERKTLLLGYTTKNEDTRTTGQFGEGYKLALLVLTRLGKNVTIYNYAKGETWKPKMVTSKRFDGEKILVIEVVKSGIFSKHPNRDLTFEIEGITVEDYAELEDLTYTKPKSGDCLETVYGTIDYRESEKGNLYIGGILTAKSDLFRYGYNINPENIKLGRDRDIVNEYEVSEMTTVIWYSAWKENSENTNTKVIADKVMREISEMMDQDKLMDVKFTTHFGKLLGKGTDYDKYERYRLYKRLAEAFAEAYVQTYYQKSTTLIRPHGHINTMLEDNIPVEHVSNHVAEVVQASKSYRKLEKGLMEESVANKDTSSFRFKMELWLEENSINPVEGKELLAKVIEEESQIIMDVYENKN